MRVSPPGKPLAGVTPCSRYKRMRMCGSVYGYPASKISLSPILTWRLCSYAGLPHTNFKVRQGAN